MVDGTKWGRAARLRRAAVVACAVLAVGSCRGPKDDTPSMCTPVPCSPGGVIGDLGRTPEVAIVEPSKGCVSGTALNIDARRIRVVLWASTDKWYVQPYIEEPYTTVCAEGRWSNGTHPWEHLVALLVDSTYIPGETRSISHHPSIDSGVLAWAEYPGAAAPRTLEFSGYRWVVKAAKQFPAGPGPNYFSDSQDNVWVDERGLHLRITYREGKWWCAEVYLESSLGYGAYAVQIATRLDSLDQSVVVAPLFTYENESRELDIETGGDALIPGPLNAQFVVQPYTHGGNMTRFTLPADSATSHRIAWTEAGVEFATWRGHALYPPTQEDSILGWTNQGPDNPPPGNERVHMNAWLLGGRPPLGDGTREVTIRAFDFRRE